MILQCCFRKSQGSEISPFLTWLVSEYTSVKYYYAVWETFFFSLSYLAILASCFKIVLAKFGQWVDISTRQWSNANIFQKCSCWFSFFLTSFGLLGFSFFCCFSFFCYFSFVFKFVKTFSIVFFFFKIYRRNNCLEQQIHCRKIQPDSKIPIF